MRRPKVAPIETSLRRAAIEPAVQKAVREVEVVDVQTRLREPSIAEHRLAGIDDLLNDARLVAEALRTLDVAPRRFWHLTIERRSELLWRHLFCERSPLSHAAHEVLVCLKGLGLEPRKDELPKLRRWFAEKRPDWLVDRVLETARLRTVVVASSPLEEAERRRWEKGFKRDPRFRIALSIDPLLADWPRAARQLADLEYQVSLDFGGDTEKEIRRFLEEWSRRTEPVYVTASLPSELRFPHSGPAARLLERVVLPHCARIGRPFALRLGERPAMNPELERAGEGLAVADLGPVLRMLKAATENRFLLSALASENQHEVSALASIFPRLHPVGCGSLEHAATGVRSALEERLERIGPSFTAAVSGARVLDQLIARWERARSIVSEVLTERYGVLADSGWPVTRSDIQRDAGALLGGAFESFAGL